jgi:hypothetical protein
MTSFMRNHIFAVWVGRAGGRASSDWLAGGGGGRASMGRLWCAARHRPAQMDRPTRETDRNEAAAFVFAAALRAAAERGA